ncbi:hypothetical protein HY212_07415 [Candidatus Pacearchaeota archaeon]|nr:hypothetical protein [Candidatus Pacearchaeota archaeon]
MLKKRGQLTIFIIIGIAIVAIIGIVFLITNKGSTAPILPQELAPVYSSLLTCLQDDAETGVKLLQSQGGYIDLLPYEPGSLYMPFSSQLNFAGTNIPYWYYVSGNNIQKEQVPKISDMQAQLSKFIKERVSRCNLDSYNEQGYSISQGTPSASAIIRDSDVQVDLKMDFSISKGADSSVVKSHKIIVKTNLGKLYGNALNVYNKEQNELFLENYSIDILRLYAPVDGVEIQCGPLTWSAENVFNDLEQAIEVNTLSLKSSGNNSDYFSVKGLSNVRFINSRNWSRAFKVDPSQGPLLIANPVGNQGGLGILGFCYVPYHFVYDVKYPVLVQVYDNAEIFQFPMAVVIQGNKARMPLSVEGSQDEIPDFCKYKNTNTDVGIYDSRNVAVDADVTYECAGTSCYIGKTKNGMLNAEFPQCGNGTIIARAEGYQDTREIYSTINPGSVNVLMNKIQDFNIDLRLDGKTYTGDAVINFASNSSTSSIVYPQQKKISLAAGNYDVQVYIYKNSSLTLGASVQQQCVQVPNGVLGVFGITKKKCFDVNIPQQIISNALAGGGKSSYYISQSQVENAKTIQINTESLPTPDSLDQLQVNYLLYDERSLDIIFR